LVSVGGRVSDHDRCSRIGSGLDAAWLAVVHGFSVVVVLAGLADTHV